MLELVGCADRSALRQEDGQRLDVLRSVKFERVVGIGDLQTGKWHRMAASCVVEGYVHRPACRQPTRRYGLTQPVIGPPITSANWLLRAQRITVVVWEVVPPVIA